MPCIPSLLAGKLHLPFAESPEYANANDTNFDLALFRWGVGVLLHVANTTHPALKARLRHTLSRVSCLCQLPLLKRHRSVPGHSIAAEGALKRGLWAAAGGKEPDIRPKPLLAGRAGARHVAERGAGPDAVPDGHAQRLVDRGWRGACARPPALVAPLLALPHHPPQPRPARGSSPKTSPLSLARVAVCASFHS